MSELSDQAQVPHEGIEAILNESRLRSQIVSEARDCWGEGKPADAQAFLAEHPEYGTPK